MAWWYYKVGVCLPHFLSSVVFLLQRCLPMISSSCGKRKYDIYFWFEKWNASDVCCLFWEKNWENTRLNIFIIFIRSGTVIMDYNLVSPRFSPLFVPAHRPGCCSLVTFGTRMWLILHCSACGWDPNFSVSCIINLDGFCECCLSTWRPCNLKLYLTPFVPHNALTN